MRVSERVHHRLELQAIELEELFARVDLQAQVQGGALQDNGVIFHVQLAQALPPAYEQQVEAELSDTFDRGVRMRTASDRCTLRITLATADDYGLCANLEQGLELAPRMAAIGYTAEGAPVILNYSEPSLEHVIFLGAEGAGKTAALRTCAVALAMSSRQSQIQMIFLDPQADRPELPLGPGMHALHHLPHALAAVVTDTEDAAEVLRYLDDEARYRRAHAVRSPTIVIFIDNVDILAAEGSPTLRKALEQLLASGAESGIHCIMSARPDGRSLADLLSLKPVLRIVGRVMNQRQARLASELVQSGAENLMGKGDFLITRDDRPVRFQTMYVDAYDLHWCLETLQRRRPPSIVARPAAARPSYAPARPPSSATHTFTFDGREISLGS